MSSGVPQVTVPDLSNDTQANASTALQAAGLLQDQRPVALRRHDHPAEAPGVHVSGLVEAGDGVEPVARHIGRVIEQPKLGALRRGPVEMPGEPAQDVVGRRVEAAGAGHHPCRLHVGHRLAVEVMALQHAGRIAVAQRQDRVLESGRIEDALLEQRLVRFARGVGQRRR